MVFSAACLRTRTYGLLLALAGTGLLAVASHAQESTAPVSFSVGDDGRVRIEVPSAADRYHVLYYRSDPDDAATEYAVALHMGAAGRVTLTEPLGIGRTGAYRVATFDRDAPGDVDGDGTDDLAELAREDKTKRAPLSAARSAEDIVIAIPDMATFQKIAYLDKARTIYTKLSDVQHLRFIFHDPEEGEPEVYFANMDEINRSHAGIARVAGVPDFALKGLLMYHPHLRGPGGVGTFRFTTFRFATFEEVSKRHEILARSLPFLRNNLMYTVYPEYEERYQREKAKYDASRVPVLLLDELYEHLLLAVLNPAVGYGLLRVFGPGERPTFRDIAILRTLPNDLTTAAGVISLVPQTPLSHVNLRAVQNDVPNIYINNALDDPTISGLIGKYVRLEARAALPSSSDGQTPVNLQATYTIREATAEEVEAHHADRRPSVAQTPTRNLAVTTYKDLDDIGFADSDAFGVKTANLATLRTFGFAEGTVPDGYALPFYFYDAFMKHNDFYAAVDALLANADFQGGIATRDAELKKLRRRIRNGAVPDWMDTQLETLRGLFPAGTAIRCRSSTNNEDLPGFSGAGLYDSYTHHPNEGHLAKSIKQVFASL